MASYSGPVTPRRLEPLPVPTGAGVLELLPTLRAALSGSGPAVLPHAAGTTPPLALRPGEPLTEDEDSDHDPTVAVVVTSGSTGAAKGALLSASALLASASATHDRLGGPGRWLLALPAQHVAGLQVLLRSLVTRADPTILDLTHGFDPARFAAAAAATTGGRRYTSLVPTQVRRLLDAGSAARDALAGFDAVLVGGAACDPGLVSEATAAGARLVLTYGMSETCGGCVYDGRPLDGVQVVVDDDGRIRLGGPVLARGYRGGDADGAFAPAEGERWFRTDDGGRLEPDGRLTVLGRQDDMIVTGGAKVAPTLVEAVLLGLPEIAEAVVVGAADPHWGQRVVAAVVVAAGVDAPALASIRARVTEQLGAQAAPHQLLVLERLPLRGPGKPDRIRLAALAQLSERV
jgi:O-succinylbenzoic acid--CoA ligase